MLYKTEVFVLKAATDLLSLFLFFIGELINWDFVVIVVQI